jgi:hypothetical protein
MKTFFELYSEAVESGKAPNDAARFAESEHGAQLEASESASELAEMSASELAEIQAEVVRAQSEYADLTSATNAVHHSHIEGPLKPWAVLMAEMSSLGHSGDESARLARDSWLLHPVVVAARK